MVLSWHKPRGEYYAVSRAPSCGLFLLDLVIKYGGYPRVCKRVGVELLLFRSSGFLILYTRSRWFLPSSHSLQLALSFLPLWHITFL